jgi:hypothetical protein
LQKFILHSLLSSDLWSVYLQLIIIIFGAEVKLGRFLWHAFCFNGPSFLPLLDWVCLSKSGITYDIIKSISTFYKSKFQNEEFSRFLWDFPWYKLPKKQQKELCFIMLNANQSSEIELFYIGPLNLETFLNVWKIITH